MNDEIKEILDNLKNKDNDIKGINFLKYQDLTRGEINLLLDYITNLQQENKIRQQDINNLAYQLAKMKEENERLKEENNNKAINDYAHAIDESWYRELYDDYKSRCEKASNKLSFIDEALENDTLNVPLCITKINSALNILQNGSEDNE